MYKITLFAFRGHLGRTDLLVLWVERKQGGGFRPEADYCRIHRFCVERCTII